MAHLRVQKMQAVFKAHALYLGVCGGIELRALSAVAEVNAVDILHQLYRLLLADILIEGAAELVCDIVFSVGKCARAAEAAHDIAHGALCAGLHLFPVYRAAALIQRASELEHGDLQSLIRLREFIGGENTAGACADNDHIIICHCISPPIFCRGAACFSKPKSFALPFGEHEAQKCILS